MDSYYVIKLISEGLTGLELDRLLKERLPDSLYEEHVGVVESNYVEIYFSSWPADVNGSSFNEIGNFLSAGGLRKTKVFLLRGTSTAVIRTVRTNAHGDIQSSTNTHNQANKLFN